MKLTFATYFPFIVNKFPFAITPVSGLLAKIKPIPLYLWQNHSFYQTFLSANSYTTELF